jgi:predicted nucleic acid-binding protein
MATSQVVWVIDTSSIIEVRRSTQKRHREQTFRKMTQLVTEGRLAYPPQVVAELERFAQPKSPDPQLAWAKQNALAAHGNGSCSLDDVKEI